MFVDTTVNVQRNNAQVATGVPVQIDTASEMMGAYYNQAHPYDVYEVYCEYSDLVFQRGDLLIDQDPARYDPLTNTNALYRVVGNPMRFPTGYTEMMANKFVGAQT